MTTTSAEILQRFRQRRSRAKAPLTLVEEEIVSGALHVHFQPLVDLKSREVFAYEALARSHSQRFSGPVALFEAALAANCCGELGLLLRTLAMETAPTGQALFLNVHPKEFDEGWLVRPDEPMFWHPEQVYLEITEGVPLSHVALCHSVLREVRSKGVFLAVDDLGAGYSNLKYIADLSPEVVKLDRELVAGLSRGSRQLRLMAQLVRLCQEMGAQVVAEGIETELELEAVIEAGAHFGQGFLLARPAFPAPPVAWPLPR